MAHRTPRRTQRTAIRALSLGAVGLMTPTFIVLGCGGGDGKSAKMAGVRSVVIEHEPCDEAGHKVDALDANNDGKPDIRRVYGGDREICRITDLNHDGKPDMYEYYDGSGQLRRREADYDDNGIVNAIEYFENGKLVRRDLDTTNQGRIDTWDYFDPSTGRRTKRERDASGDGRLDQWWSYEGEKVSIAMDRNGDGKPDPDATVVLGGSATPPPAFDAGAPPAPPTSSPPPVTPEAPSLDTPDAGAPGKPKRGGAKR